MMTPLSRASTASEAPRVSPWNIASVVRGRLSTAAREAETAIGALAPFNATSLTSRSPEAIATPQNEGRVSPPAPSRS